MGEGKKWVTGGWVKWWLVGWLVGWLAGRSVSGCAPLPSPPLTLTEKPRRSARLQLTSTLHGLRSPCTIWEGVRGGGSEWVKGRGLEVCQHQE